MSEYTCPTCKATLWKWTKDAHICPPMFYAIVPDLHDEEKPIEFYCDGRHEKDVAEFFASFVYPDVKKPDDMQVWVRNPHHKAWSKFSVTVEHVPSFTVQSLDT